MTNTVAAGCVTGGTLSAKGNIIIPLSLPFDQLTFVNKLNGGKQLKYGHHNKVLFFLILQDFKSLDTCPSCFADNVVFKSVHVDDPIL